MARVSPRKIDELKEIVRTHYKDLLKLSARDVLDNTVTVFVNANQRQAFNSTLKNDGNQEAMRKILDAVLQEEWETRFVEGFLNGILKITCLPGGERMRLMGELDREMREVCSRYKQEDQQTDLPKSVPTEEMRRMKVELEAQETEITRLKEKDKEREKMQETITNLQKKDKENEQMRETVTILQQRDKEREKAITILQELVAKLLRDVPHLPETTNESYTILITGRGLGREILAYFPDKDKYYKAATIPDDRFAFGMVWVDEDESLYLIGGLNGSGSGIKFSARSKIWNDIVAMERIEGHTKAVFVNGTIYAFALVKNPGTVEKFKLGSKQWVPGPSMPKSLLWFSVAVVNNQFIFVGGGCDANGDVENAVYRLDVQSKDEAWEDMRHMICKRYDYGLCAIDNQLHAFGGNDGNSCLSSAEKMVEKWSAIASMKIARDDIGVAVIGDRAFLGGGKVGVEDYSLSLECYDSRSGNNWTKKKDMPAAPGFRTSMVTAKIPNQHIPFDRGLTVFTEADLRKKMEQIL